MKHASGMAKSRAALREKYMFSLLRHALTPVNLQGNHVYGILLLFILSVIERIGHLLGQP